MAIMDVPYTPQFILLLQQLEHYSDRSNPLAEFGDLPGNLTISSLAEAIQNGVLGIQYDPTNTTVSDLSCWIHDIGLPQQYSSPPHVAALAGPSPLTFGQSVSPIQGYHDGSPC